MLRRILQYVLTIAALAPTFSRAADQSCPMADRVPADAVFYFGWQGADSIAQNIANTHLQAIMAQCHLADLFTQTAPAAIDKFVQPNDPKTAAHLHHALALAGVLWHHPTTVFLSSITLAATGPDDPPIIKAALVCQAGPDAAKLHQVFDNVLQQLTENHYPARIVENGDTFIFALGFGEADTILPADASASLSTNADFKSAIAPLDVHPVVAAFLNIAKLLAQIEALPTPGSKGSQQMTAFLDASGLRCLKTFAGVGGFDGADWAEQAFLAMSGPRTGFFSDWNTTPISNDLLARVPATAATLAARHLDVAAIVNQILITIDKVDAKAGQGARQGLGAVQLMTAVRLQQDILDPLGPDWAAYSVPQGTAAPSLILVNKPRDPATLLARLPMLQNAACAIAGSFMRNMHPMPGTVTVGNVDVNYVQLANVRPGWAIDNGFLYWGMTPESVGAAAAPFDKSILDNPDYQAAMKRLGNHPAVAISFDDLPNTVANTYAVFSQYQSIGATLAAAHGLTLPDPLLPPLELLRANVIPAAGVVWVDDAGWHSRGFAPFPGYELLSPSSLVTIGAASTGVAILLPSLAKAREQANRVKCASNERQIGQAILMWSVDHKGQSPPDLGALAVEENLSPQLFICPDTNTAAPHDAKSMTHDQLAKWVDDHSDYVYIPGMKFDANSAQTPILYDKFGNHARDGVNVLFADGHVEFVRTSRAHTLLDNH